MEHMEGNMDQHLQNEKDRSLTKGIIRIISAITIIITLQRKGNALPVENMII